MMKLKVNHNPLVGGSNPSLATNINILKSLDNNIVAGVPAKLFVHLLGLLGLLAFAKILRVIFYSHAQKRHKTPNPHPTDRMRER